MKVMLADLEAKDRAAPILDAENEDDTKQHLESMKTGGTGKVVYLNGVFDMCHFGHQRHFQNAAKHGRLIVGVHGDTACAGYKRQPTMTAEERAAQVSGCRGVWKVLLNAPLVGITEEFMAKYKIDVVALGQEYTSKDIKDDQWYQYPRESGRFVETPRTEGVSTSDLIRRCG